MTAWTFAAVGTRRRTAPTTAPALAVRPKRTAMTSTPSSPAESPAPQPRELSDCALVDHDDFTFYYPQVAAASRKPDPIVELAHATQPNVDKRAIRARRSHDLSIPLVGARPDELTKGSRQRTEPDFIAESRVLACSCCEGQFWSVTVRSSEGRAHKNRKAPAPAKRHDRKWTSLYAPSDSRKPPNLFSIAEVVDPLQRLLFPRGCEPTGAIFVTGETASAKSQVARALVHYRLSQLLREYLDAWPKQESDGYPRRPHLVTVEDPIEKWLFDKKTFLKSFRRSRGTLSRWSVDYTPRALNVDVVDIKSGLFDALRQTPRVVYVGESRKDKDIYEVMKFAGTGHLVVTTAHAGSLTEAMARILKAMEATTSADRAVVAERVLGLVHMRRVEVTPSTKGAADVPPEPRYALLPALWKRAGAGRHAFVGDGLSAFMPGTPCELPAKSAQDHVELPADADTVHPSNASGIGRYWFARQLLKAAGARLTKDGETRESPAFSERLRASARALDLGGR